VWKNGQGGGEEYSSRVLKRGRQRGREKKHSGRPNSKSNWAGICQKKVAGKILAKTSVLTGIVAGSGGDTKKRMEHFVNTDVAKKL